MTTREQTIGEPPDREFLLSCDSRDKERINIIKQWANCLVKYDSWNGPGDDPITAWSEDQFLSIFQRLQIAWRRTPDRKELIGVFRNLAESQRLPNINKIVCFGLGSPGAWNQDEDGRPNTGNWRVCSQYAAALDLARGISLLTHKRKIEVYAQDPNLKLKDIKVLTRAGIKVVNPFHQEGYTLIDQDTFIFSVHLTFTGHIEAMSLQCARPALILWSDNPFQRHRKHPARAAALVTLDKEYDRIEGIRALELPSEEEQKTGTSEWDDYAFVVPEDPVLSETSLYVPKVRYYRAPVADESGT